MISSLPGPPSMRSSPSPPSMLVVAGPAEQPVVAAAAVHPVVARVADQRVVAAEALDHVATAGADQPIGVGRPVPDRRDGGGSDGQGDEHESEQPAHRSHRTRGVPGYLLEISEAATVAASAGLRAGAMTAVIARLRTCEPFESRRARVGPGCGSNPLGRVGSANASAAGGRLAHHHDVAAVHALDVEPGDVAAAGAAASPGGSSRSAARACRRAARPRSWPRATATAAARRSSGGAPSTTGPSTSSRRTSCGRRATVRIVMPALRTTPTAASRLNAAAYACRGYEASRPRPRGASVRRIGGCATEPLRSVFCEVAIRRLSTLRTTTPKPPGAVLPMVATGRPSASYSRAISVPPYGTAPRLTPSSGGRVGGRRDRQPADVGIEGVERPRHHGLGGAEPEVDRAGGVDGHAHREQELAGLAAATLARARR